MRENMMRRAIVICTLLVLSQVPFAAAQAPLVVGEDIFEVYETSHPYVGTQTGVPQVVRAFEVSFPGATYIAPHFDRFELAPGDFVIVRSPDGSRSWRYEGSGKGDMGRNGGFWGIHVPGNRAIVELHTRSAGGAYGFTIDRFARGLSDEELGITGVPESLCGTDDSDEAKCHSGTTMYTRGRAVARLLINGGSACTGWLFGDEGHVVTNNHCIGGSGDAGNTDFEFMAEGANCSTDCTSWWACPGTVEATSSSFVQTDVGLDYTLVKLPTNVSGTYGFLQARSNGPSLGEQIYIPQHPAGWGKRLAVDSTHSQNPSGKGEVDSVSEPACQPGGPGGETGYYLDTQGGSSGSPVLASSDNCVVALHHCRGSAACTQTGGDPNRGLPINQVIGDMGSNVPNNAICDCVPDEPDGEVTCDDGKDNDCDGLVDDEDPDCGGCTMGLRLESDTYRPGDVMFYRVGLQHNRLETVTTVFRTFVVDAAGDLVASTRSEELTFEFGDRINFEGMVEIPADIAPGEYKMVVGINEMLQGIARREKSFTIVE